MRPGKRVLVRVDLNVPMEDGAGHRRHAAAGDAADDARTVAIAARSSCCCRTSAGRRVRAARTCRPRSWSSRFTELTGRSVRFIEDCQGPEAERAISTMLPGNIGILENTRFHAGEEKNDPELAKGMAALGDYYVNDAFSAAHRAHASTEGIAHLLPSFAGRAMEAELKALERALGDP